MPVSAAAFTCNASSERFAVTAFDNDRVAFARLLHAQEKGALLGHAVAVRGSEHHDTPVGHLPDGMYIGVKDLPRSASGSSLQITGGRSPPTPSTGSERRRRYSYGE